MLSIVTHVTKCPVPPLQADHYLQWGSEIEPTGLALFFRHPEQPLSSSFMGGKPPIPPGPRCARSFVRSMPGMAPQLKETRHRVKRVLGGVGIVPTWFPSIWGGGRGGRLANLVWCV